MNEPLIVLEARYNKRNSSRCELYPDRVVLSTQCTGGLVPVYGNRTRTIPLTEITKVVISNGGTGFFVHHPNAIHFMTRDSQRTLDELFRDARVTSADYIDEGVQQFCPQSAADLTEKIGLASQIKAYIEDAQRQAPL